VNIPLIEPREPLWERRLKVTTAEQTHALGAALGGVLEAGDLLVLTGELGAGKTTFTQGLGEGLGVRAGIISPTFVLVRIHPNLPDGPRPGGPDLVHVDAYRLESAAEIDDIDLENTMDSSVTVVEWGRDRVEHLSDSRLEVDLHRSVGSVGVSATNVADGSRSWILTLMTTTNPAPSFSAVSAHAGPRLRSFLKPRSPKEATDADPGH